MNASRQLHRRLPDKAERVTMISGAIAGWILFVLLFYFANSRAFIFSGVLSGPCVLVLTFFALGGDIPLKWREKGYRRLMVIPVVFWISLLAAFAVACLLPLGED